MPEIQGLQFVVTSEVTKAIEQIDTLGNALTRLEKLKGKANLSSVANGLKKLDEVFDNLGTERIEEFAGALERFGSINPRMSRSFVDNFGLLTNYLRYTSSEDIEKLDAMTTALSRLSGLGSIRLPNISKGGIQNAAGMSAVDIQGKEEPFTEVDNSANTFLSHLARVREQILGVESEEQRLSTVDAFVRSKSEADVLRMKLEAARAKLEELLQTANPTGRTQAAIASVTAQIQRLESQLVSASSTGTRAGSSLARASSSITRIGSAASRSNKPLIDFVSIFKKIGGGLTKRVSSSLRGILGKFTQFFNSIKRIMFYRLIRSAIRALTQGFTEGLKNMYAYSQAVGTQFAGSMDRLASSALYLKNSLASVAAPLINALAPAIDYVADKIVALFNLIAQFISRLTGKETYTAAKKVATTWQDATSGAVGGAKKDVDEFRRYVLGFDELNILGQSSSGSGGGSGGGAGGGLDGSDMFEERTIDEGVSSFADAIREAFQNRDWEELGRVLGDGFNRLIDSVPWAAAGEKVGTTITGFFTTAHNFFEEADFITLGDRVAEFINGALKTTDHYTVGETIADVIQAGIDTVGGLLGGLEWKEVGNAVTESLSGFFDDSTRWMNEHDWEGVGKNIVSSAEDFFDGGDWGKLSSSLAETVGTGVRSVAQTVGGIFEQVFGGWWERIKKFIDTHDSPLELLRDWFLGGLIDLGNWFSNNTIDPFLRGLSGNQEFDFTDWAVSGLRKISLSQIPFFEEIIRATENAFSPTGNDEIRRIGEDQFESSMSVGVSLKREGWTTLDKYVGELSAKPFALGKSGWTSLDSYVGNISTRRFALGKTDWTTLDKYVGDLSTRKFALGKDNWTSLDNYVGGLSTKPVKLKKEGWSTLDTYVGTKVDVGVQLYKSGWTDFKSFIGLKNGGIVTNNGAIKFFRQGGYIDGPVTGNFPRYAGGTLRAGSLFAAGEAGPELVGHINGRTEVLNASQIAQTMYRSVIDGMTAMRGRMGGTEGVSMEDLAYVVGNQVSAAMANLETSGGDQRIVCEVYLDSDRIATAVTRGQKAQNRRYSPTARS